MVEKDQFYKDSVASVLTEKNEKIKRLEEKLKDAQHTIDGAFLELHEAEQVLGQASGYYPWFKDDQKNFPGATEKDGVCVGEHTVVTLAMETVDRLKKYEALEGAIRDFLSRRVDIFPEIMGIDNVRSFNRLERTLEDLKLE